MKHVSEQKVNKFIDLVNQEYKKNGQSETFLKCVQTCLQTENIPFIIEFCARVKGVNAAAFFGNFVAQNGTPEQNFIFALRVPTSDKQKHIDVIAKSGDAELCYRAAKTLENVNKEECGKVVINKGAYITNYLYARDVVDNVGNVDYEAHKKVVFESKDANLIYAYAMDVPNISAYELYNKLVEVKADGEQCYNVYKKMTCYQRLQVQLNDLEKDLKSGKNHISKQRRDAIAYYATQVFNLGGRSQIIEDCETRCLNIGNANLLLTLAKTNIFDLDKISKKIAECGNSLQNVEFMQLIKQFQQENNKININHLTILNNKKILNSKDAYSNYLVAKYIRPSNISMHENAVLNSKDVKTNILYAKNIEGANIKKHQEVVMQYGTIQDVLDFVKLVKGASVRDAYVSIQEKGASEKVLKKLEFKLNKYEKMFVLINEFESSLKNEEETK